MSLREWDRKASILSKEIDSLMGLAKQRCEDEAEKKLRSIQQKIPELESSFARSISLINSQSQRRGFFTRHEKAILHWAGEYGKKAQAFFRDYSLAFNELFWARLLQTRGESVSAHGAGRFFSGKGRRGPMQQQRKLFETRRMLKDKLEAIAKRNANLESRYTHLAISKENRSAVSPKSVSPAYLRETHESLREGAGQWELPPGYLRSEAFKVSRLVAKVATPGVASAARPQNQSGFKAAQGMDANPLASFDYLHLDEFYES